MPVTTITVQSNTSNVGSETSGNNTTVRPIAKSGANDIPLWTGKGNRLINDKTESGSSQPVAIETNSIKNGGQNSMETNSIKNGGQKTGNLRNRNIDSVEKSDDKFERLAGKSNSKAAGVRSKLGHREKTDYVEIDGDVQTKRGGVLEKIGKGGSRVQTFENSGGSDYHPHAMFDLDDIVHPPKNATRTKKALHILLFFVIFGVDVIDFFSDWLFFADVKAAETGLVYGEPESAVVWCLLLFSIIGTATFIFECVNLWWEFFRNNPWVDSDFLSAVVIWIEDIPQATISMYIVLCREEAISVFQLCKAAIILLSVVVRIVITSVKFCNKEAVRSHHHVKLKVAILLGIILEAFMAGVIFFMTQTEPTHTGDVAFRVPSTIIDDSFNDQKYLQRVGIFMHKSDISDVGVHDPDRIDWIHLTSILDLKSIDEINYRFEYSQLPNNITHLAISEKMAHFGQWMITECYIIDKKTSNVQLQPNTTCSTPNFLNDSTAISIKLQYEHPGYLFKIKIYGDVYMNIMEQQDGVCKPVTTWADSIEESFSDKMPFAFRFYRFNDTLEFDDIRHLLYEAGTPRFYRKTDLTDIRKVWTTGWRGCAGGGHITPIYKKDLEVSCS